MSAYAELQSGEDLHVREVVVRESTKECCSVHDGDNVEGHVLSYAQIQGVALYEEIWYIDSRDHEGVR
jgi:hypothetical protein